MDVSKSVSYLLQYSPFRNTNSFLVNGLTAALGTIGVVLAGSYTYHSYLSFSRRGEAPVRWSWLPLLGFALELGKRPIEFLQECQNIYGDIFGIIVGGNRMFIITDPHSYNLILKPSKSLSWVEFHNQVLNNFFGVAKYITSNHVMDDSLMRNYFSKYLFSDNSLNNLTQRMQRHLMKMMGGFQAGTFPMYDVLGKFIFHASVASLLNEAAGSDESLFKSFTDFDKALPICLAGINIANLPDACTGRKVLLDTCKKYTEDNCELLNKRREYFTKLVSDEQMKVDDMATLQVPMLWASVGNTMPATFWVVYYILNDTTAYARLMQEVDSVYASLPSGDSDGNGDGCPLLTQDHLNNMTFTDACITEALRLSSGSMIMRYASEPCEVTLSSGKTFKFRKGDQIGICPPLTHLDNEVFPDAKSFRPDRWLVGETVEDIASASTGRIRMAKGGKELVPTSVYLPFGGGPTYCPGRRFARNEIKTMLVYLVRHYHMTLPAGGSPPKGCPAHKAGGVAFPGHDGSRAGLGIFPPQHDCLITISPREH